MTPGPWEARPRRDGLANVYLAGTSREVALCLRPEDARAVALFPEFIQALAALLDSAISAGVADQPMVRAAALLDRLRERGD